MIEKGTRFAVPFEVAFPNGLVQVGDVAPGQRVPAGHVASGAAEP